MKVDTVIILFFRAVNWGIESFFKLFKLYSGGLALFFCVFEGLVFLGVWDFRFYFFLLGKCFSLRFVKVIFVFNLFCKKVWGGWDVLGDFDFFWGWGGGRKVELFIIGK